MPRMTRKPSSRRKAPPKGRAPGRGGSRAGKSGQPAFDPTEHQRQAVSALISIGYTTDVIAEVLHIPSRTLERHFAYELKHGRVLIQARIGGGIVASALAGDKTMMIFYAKTQMGWRERFSHGFEDEKGQGVNPANLFQVQIV